MATLVSTLFISLDGVAEIDPAWHFPYFDDHMAAAVADDYSGVDTLLIGRVTYDSFAGAWPDREAAGEDDAAFAARLGDVRKLVATHGDQDLGWRNAERLDGELVAAVAALKETPGLGRVLVPGSISVVRQLLAVGLLDELRLLVHPVAARHGERLFDEGEPTYPLTLLRSEVFPTGVVRLVYAPATAPEPVAYEDVRGRVGSETD
ncbi:dihydrofolate reductase family protein [Cellulosimicrobium arenosum]|uniref:Dihydrofolate reductase family protein n=1 Tax=Cellulosimicrobium arenosum TaxID=2708133 RepID=A0A927IZR3_9MICO|nr:dihydrofolate reductase family protein [Cellulosimicrobium arenosum]MBD8078727.1 dihydrofolate reductase family protein [Cellulosimicrobium arenosum]